jgi:hypothetical protein
MTLSDMLELVYRFYPRGMYTIVDEYEATEECRRQRDAARCAAAEYPKWRAMLGRLRGRFEVTNRALHMISGESFDTGYSGEIEIPGGSLGFHVSILGPYYGILRTGLPGDEPAAGAIAQEIEATYRYEPIPPEIGDTMVPDVALDARNFGEARIYECLLSHDWEYRTRPPPYPEREMPPP